MKEYSTSDQGGKLPKLPSRKGSPLPYTNWSALLALEQLSDAEFWNYAREQAYRTPSVSQAEEYLQCELGSVRCLFPLTSLYEVVLPPHRFTRLPATPTWMPGIVAWHGETIAGIDLLAYLSGSASNTSDGTLLIAHSKDLVMGLLVPAIGLTIPIEEMQPEDDGNFLSVRAEVVRGMYEDAFILDVPVLFADVVQQIGRVASHG